METRARCQVSVESSQRNHASFVKRQHCSTAQFSRHCQFIKYATFQSWTRHQIHNLEIPSFISKFHNLVDNLDMTGYFRPVSYHLAYSYYLWIKKCSNLHCLSIFFFYYYFLFHPFFLLSLVFYGF